MLSYVFWSNMRSHKCLGILQAEVSVSRRATIAAYEEKLMNLALKYHNALYFRDLSVAYYLSDPYNRFSVILLPEADT